jgi:hypothetical protein
LNVVQDSGVSGWSKVHGVLDLPGRLERGRIRGKLAIHSIVALLSRGRRRLAWIVDEVGAR